MVRLLARPVLIVAIICFAAIWVVMLTPGRAVAVPEASGAFGFAACAPPCWAGITVGQTPLLEVSRRFADSVSARVKQIEFANNGALVWGLAESGQARNAPATAFSGNLLAQAGASEVTYIHLNVEMPLWYLLLTLGDPTEVEVHQQFADIQRVEMVVRWALPQASAAVTLPMLAPEDWGLYTPASSLTITMPDQLTGLGFPLRSYHIIGRVPWQGFVPFSEYVRDAAQSVTERACGECVQAGL